MSQACSNPLQLPCSDRRGLLRRGWKLAGRCRRGRMRGPAGRPRRRARRVGRTTCRRWAARTTTPTWTLVRDPQGHASHPPKISCFVCQKYYFIQVERSSTNFTWFNVIQSNPGWSYISSVQTFARGSSRALVRQGGSLGNCSTLFPCAAGCRARAASSLASLSRSGRLPCMGTKMCELESHVAQRSASTQMPARPSLACSHARCCPGACQRQQLPGCRAGIPAAMALCRPNPTT